MTRKNKQQRSPRAFYRHGVLTLDIPTAREPILWRQPIKKVSGLSFALHELPDSARALVLRVDDGAEQIIATFDTLETANAVLDVLRELLTKARNGIGRFFCNILKWIMIILLILLILRAGIYVYTSFVAPLTINEVAVQSPSPPAPQQPPELPTVSSAPTDNNSPATPTLPTTPSTEGAPSR